MIEVSNEQPPLVEEAVAEAVAVTEAVVSASAEPEAVEPEHESAPAAASLQQAALVKMVEPPMPEPTAPSHAVAASAASVGVRAAVSQERADAMAKQRGRRRTSRMTVVAGATPGFVQVQSEPSVPLDDHVGTSRVTTTPPVVHEPSAPGVVQVTHESAVAPSHAAAASAASVGVQAAVSQERADAMAKQRGRRISRMTVVADATPGFVQVQSEPSVPLDDHVQEVVPQQEGNANDAAAALSQVEQDAASKARAARPTRRRQQMAATTTTTTSHSQAERDAVTKSRARRGMPAVEAGGPPVLPGVEHIGPPVELSRVDASKDEDDDAGLEKLARRRDEHAAALANRRREHVSTAAAKEHVSTAAAGTTTVGAVSVSSSEPTPETRKSTAAGSPASTGRAGEPARVFSNMGEDERQRRYNDKMAQMDQQHEDSVEKRAAGGSISNNPANASEILQSSTTGVVGSNHNRDDDVEGQRGRQRNYLETGAKSQEFLDQDPTVPNSMTSHMPPAITTTADRGVVVAPDVEYGEYTVQDNELAVAIAIDDDEEEQEKKLYAYAVAFDPAAKPPMYQNRRFRLYGIGGALCLVILSVVLVVGIISVGNKTVILTLPLPVTESPTVAPTTSRESVFRQFFAENVSPLVYEEGTPQFRAAEWIMNEDPKQLEPSSQRLLQRYLMAFLYFHTSNQGEWLSCNPPKDGEDDTCIFLEFARDGNDAISFTPKPGKTRWLSGQEECDWEGVECASGAVVLGFTLCEYYSKRGLIVW
jgi:hypothetical protein